MILVWILVVATLRNFFLESLFFLRLVVVFLRCREVRVEISVSLNFDFSDVQKSPRLTRSEVSRGPFRNNLKRTSGHFNRHRGFQDYTTRSEVSRGPFANHLKRTSGHLDFGYGYSVRSPVGSFLFGPWPFCITSFLFSPRPFHLSSFLLGFGRSQTKCFKKRFCAVSTLVVRSFSLFFFPVVLAVVVMISSSCRR